MSAATLALEALRAGPGGADALAPFLLVGTLASAAGVSRQGVALVGGYLFGAAGGTLATLAAVTLGAALAAEVSRRLVRPWLRAYRPAVLARLEGWGGERVFVRTLALRLFPLGSNLLVNVAAGVARVERRPFLAASLLGFAPQSALFALAGDGAEALADGRAALGASLLGLALAPVLLGVVPRRARRA